MAQVSSSTYLALSIEQDTTQSDGLYLERSTGDIVVIINGAVVHRYIDAGSQVIVSGSRLWFGGVAGSYPYLFVSTTSGVAHLGVENTNLDAPSFMASTLGAFYWLNKSVIQSFVDGYVSFTNAADSGFSGLQLGGKTSSFAGIGCSGANLIIQTADGTAGGSLQLSDTLLTAGTMTETDKGKLKIVRHVYSWSNAMVAALGASTTGDITVCTLLAKTVVRGAKIVVLTAAGTVATLTASVGITAAAYTDYVGASDIMAAAGTPYGGSLATHSMPSYSTTTVVKSHFISSGGNLSAVTASTGMVILDTELLP